VKLVGTLGSNCSVLAEQFRWVDAVFDVLKTTTDASLKCAALVAVADFGFPIICGAKGSERVMFLINILNSTPLVRQGDIAAAALHALAQTSPHASLFGVAFPPDATSITSPISVPLANQTPPASSRQLQDKILSIVPRRDLDKDIEIGLLHFLLALVVPLNARLQQETEGGQVRKHSAPLYTQGVEFILSHVPIVEWLLNRSMDQHPDVRQWKFEVVRALSDAHRSVVESSSFASAISQVLRAGQHAAPSSRLAAVAGPAMDVAY